MSATNDSRMKQGASEVSLPGQDTTGHEPVIPSASLPVGSVHLVTTTHELHKPIVGPEGYEFVESHIMSRVQSGRWGDATYRETHIVCVWRETQAAVEVERLREEVAREGREAARYLMLLQNILRARNPVEELQNKERARRAIGE